MGFARATVEMLPTSRRETMDVSFEYMADDGRDCTVIRCEPPAELGLEASDIFWVDDGDHSIRRIEIKVPGWLHMRLDLDAVDVPVPDEFFSLNGHATASSRIVHFEVQQNPQGQAGQ